MEVKFVEQVPLTEFYTSKYAVSKEFKKISLEDLCHRVFSVLSFHHLTYLIPKIKEVFEIGRSRFSSANSWWSPYHVGPAVMFVVLKMNGIFIHLPQYVALFGSSNLHFSKMLKSVLSVYPEFQKREKARIVEMFLDQIIPKITKSIEERELIINIYKRVHPFISLTKEELICAIVCVLGVLVIERPLLPISEVCKLIGVSQGNLSRIVHQKVFSRLKISPVRRLEFASSVLKTALFR